MEGDREAKPVSRYSVVDVGFGESVFETICDERVCLVA